MISYLNALAHFLVDWTCVSAVFASDAAGTELFYAILLYDTLAFSTQCVIGLVLDRIRSRTEKRGQGSCGLVESLGMGIVAFGAVLLKVLSVSGYRSGFLFMLGIVVIGLGNSLFHVAGGIVTYKRSGGKAAPLGVFVAPGAFGVTLGTLFPQTDWAAAVLLIAVCAVSAVVYGRMSRAEISAERGRPEQPEEPEDFPALSVILLTAAVAVRAIGGSAVSFTWKTGVVSALLLTLFVFLGKSLGGFVCDRTGASKMAAVTIPAAAVLTAFLSQSMAASLAGQFLINLSMPVTLWLLHRLLPKEPGLAFGLAASALWPGTAAGHLIDLAGSARQILIIISFLFGTFAIIYAEHNRRT
jgi:FSR family fosmidomycin resistance protein-like MFS transporter